MLDTNFYKAKSQQLGWPQVGGLAAVKARLTEALLWPVKYNHLYKQLGMKESGGLLLYGPSGCGKTLIASALASESKLNFISVKGPELLSKYIGSSEQNVRELFAKAQKARPCIVFFDEFESLAPRRGHDSTGVTDRVVNQLLTQLDGVEQLEGVYLLAATSRPDLIDQALLRPGRIDEAVCVGYPEAGELAEIFRVYLEGGMSVGEGVCVEEMGGLCEEFTGADVKAVVCDALLRAFRRVREGGDGGGQVLRSEVRVERQDLVDAVRGVAESVNREERRRLRRM